MKIFNENAEYDFLDTNSSTFRFDRGSGNTKSIFKMFV